DDARDGRRVCPPWHPRERAVPRTDPDAADGRAARRRGPTRPPPRTRAHRTVRRGRRGGARRPVPRVRRVVADDGCVARRPRRHLGRLRHTGGMMELGRLEASVRNGDVDTVLVVFPDLQGRLMGKRVTGHFFVDEVAAGGIHACNYLLAVDVEMNPLAGYRFASWDQGYGDVKALPDLATLRPVPWLEKTALVMCDLVDDDDEPVEVSPR